MSSLEYLQSAEAHEGQSEQTCGYEAYGEALEALGVFGGVVNLLTNTCEEDDSQHEAKTTGDTVNNRLDEVVVVLNVQKNNTENSSVGSDKGKVDTQCRVQ